MSQDRVNDSLKRRLQRSVGEDRQALVEGLPYEVGFAKPPRHARFRPGVSGNPRGRPKGAQNLSTILAQELSAKVEITENGRRRRISKGQVMIRQLANKAAGGDLKALAQVVQMAQRAQAEPKDGGSASAAISGADLRALAELGAIFGIKTQAQEAASSELEPGAPARGDAL
jgi:hypothetical protein